METPYRKISESLQKFLEEANFGPLSKQDDTPLKNKIYTFPSKIIFYRRSILYKLLRLYLIHSQKMNDGIIWWDPLIGSFFPIDTFPVKLNEFVCQNVGSEPINNPNTDEKFSNRDELLVQNTFDHWLFHLSDN